MHRFGSGVPGRDEAESAAKAGQDGHFGKGAQVVAQGAAGSKAVPGSSSRAQRAGAPFKPRKRIAPEDRARQFMPFAALKGYYDLVQSRERVEEPFHVLTEEEALALSRTVARLKKGAVVRVVHYEEGAYVATCGVLSQIDTVFRNLTVVKRRIEFDAVRSIEELDS